MENIHQGKIIVITGAAQGIGLTLAKFLNAKGAYVVIADINLKAAEDALSSFPNENVEAIHCDVTSKPSTVAMAEAIVANHQKIDVLINNAGIFPVSLFEDVTLDQWQRVLDIDLTGTFLSTQAVYPYMKQAKQGKIINIASISGRVGGVGFTHYSAAKAGVIGFTKALAKEVGSLNIQVNAVAPGIIDTETTQKVFPSYALKDYINDVPLNRLGLEADIQGIVSFLCSDDSNYITGQTLTVDGGYTMI
jgi:3-oxoacyl-[acyl-carrier protein] reductase